MKVRNWSGLPFRLVCDGTDAGAGAGAGDAGTGTGTGAAGGTDDKTPKTFTKEEVDRLIATEKQTTRKQQDALVQQLEELKKTKGMSDQQISELNKKIEEISTQHLSKEELAKREQDRVKKDYDTKLDATTKEAQTWQSRFTEKVMETEIISEANSADAYRVHQVLGLLKPLTKVKEVQAEDGTGTGRFESRVSFPSVDAKGKPITLDMTVPETIKFMQSSVEYANLFKVKGTGGVGGGPSPSGGSAGKKTAEDIAKMDDATFQEYRKKNPNLI
jgi:CRISPR/Cas system CSM-associated protein Csm4 (group 5 of RAMP superfamily)